MIDPAIAHILLGVMGGWMIGMLMGAGGMYLWFARYTSWFRRF
jgi:hypothetical protein